MILKFKAWYKPAKCWLTEIDIYADGTIGMIAGRFESLLPEKYSLMYGDVYEKTEEGEEVVGNLMEGDDYIWIESGDFVLMVNQGRGEHDWSPFTISREEKA